MPLSFTCPRVPSSFQSLMPFHWYYLQFHSRVGSAARQLKAFSRRNLCGKHELILSGREVKVWFRHYCHSQVWPPLVCAYMGSTGAVHALWIFPCCFLCGCASRAELFFGLPSARLALGQLLSVSAGGFREETLLEKKREGSSRGSRKPISVCRPLQLSFSTARKKEFSYSLLCSLCFALWCKECVWKVGFVYHVLCFPYCSITVWMLVDLYSLWSFNLYCVVMSQNDHHIWFIYWIIVQQFD